MESSFTQVGGENSIRQRFVFSIMVVGGENAKSRCRWMEFSPPAAMAFCLYVFDGRQRELHPTAYRISFTVVGGAELFSPPTTGG